MKAVLKRIPIGCLDRSLRFVRAKICTPTQTLDLGRFRRQRSTGQRTPHV